MSRIGRLFKVGEYVLLTSRPAPIALDRCYTMKHIQIGDTIIAGSELPFVLHAGPCQIESRNHTLVLASGIAIPKSSLLMIW